MTSNLDINITDEQAKILFQLMRLITAEFESDPMSVQCFDLESVVKPAIEIVEKIQQQNTF